MDGSERIGAVVADLERLIEELTALGADKLPPERDLAEKLCISRSMLRRGLDVLEHTGSIVRVKGRAGGAFVRAVAESAPLPSAVFDAHTRKVERSLNTIKGIPQMLQEQDFVPDTRVISEGVETAPPNIAEALGLRRGAPVVSLLRLRLADSRPLSLERMYLDAGRFPGLLTHGPIRSLYDLLEKKYAVTITAVDELIEVIAASRQVSELLQLKAGAQVLVLRRIGRLQDGTAVEASIDIFRTDMMRLAVRTVIDRD